MSTSFQRKVYEAVKQIPRGYVATYGSVASHIGIAGASRAVGTALKNNPSPIIIPCHRVVPADLSIGHFFGDADGKRELLEEEGVTFKGNKIDCRHVYTWDTAPLS